MRVESAAVACAVPAALVCGTHVHNQGTVYRHKWNYDCIEVSDAAGLRALGGGDRISRNRN